MQRPINDRSEDSGFSLLLQAENLILGTLLLIMTGAFALKALLF